MRSGKDIITSRRQTAKACIIIFILQENHSKSCRLKSLLLVVQLVAFSKFIHLYLKHCQRFNRLEY